MVSITRLIFWLSILPVGLALTGCAKDTVRSFKGGSIALEPGKVTWKLNLWEGMIDNGGPLIGFASINFQPTVVDYTKLLLKSLKVTDDKGIVQFEATNRIMSLRENPYSVNESDRMYWLHIFDKREIPFCLYSIEGVAVCLDEEGKETNHLFKFNGNIVPQTREQNSFISNY